MRGNWPQPSTWEKGCGGRKGLGPLRPALLIGPFHQVPSSLKSYSGSLLPRASEAASFTRNLISIRHLAPQSPPFIQKGLLTKTPYPFPTAGPAAPHSGKPSVFGCSSLNPCLPLYSPPPSSRKPSRIHPAYTNLLLF